MSVGDLVNAGLTQKSATCFVDDIKGGLKQRKWFLVFDHKIILFKIKTIIKLSTTFSAIEYVKLWVWLSISLHCQI